MFFGGTVSVLQDAKSLEMMVVAQMNSLKNLSLGLEFLSSTCTEVCSVLQAVEKNKLT